MTTNTPAKAQPQTTIDRVRGMMARHNLNQAQMGRLMGVPQGTIGNWLGGTRQPNQVVKQFLAVLEQAELFYPSFFQSLLTRAKKLG